jgi:tRNA-specific 2-thiouridylase
MSGGVDSSVAAALLHDAGVEVVGVSMQLYDQREGATETFGRCCSLDDLHDARSVAQTLGIRHYVLNLERPFREKVIDNFIAEYAAGRTPIPCTHCNTDLKFATLVERAAGFGAPRVATGHYARIVVESGGRRRLTRGRDASKDQSYFLFGLTQAQLTCAEFPVGDMSKTDVRAYAERRGLPVANKPDSQEICFVPNNDYAAFVTRELESVPAAGVITDTAGRVLGRHDGVHRYTIGQRKGLRLSASEPLYVTDISATDARITVGSRADLERVSFEVESVNWVSGETPTAPIRTSVQIRHRHEPAPAVVTPSADGGAQVVFDAPERAITPGQAAVFYDGDEVVGGGWIARQGKENGK